MCGIWAVFVIFDLFSVQVMWNRRKSIEKCPKSFCRMNLVTKRRVKQIRIKQAENVAVERNGSSSSNINGKKDVLLHLDDKLSILHGAFARRSTSFHYTKLKLLFTETTTTTIRFR